MSSSTKTKRDGKLKASYHAWMNTKNRYYHKKHGNNYNSKYMRNLSFDIKKGMRALSRGKSIDKMFPVDVEMVPDPPVHILFDNPGLFNVIEKILGYVWEGIQEETKTLPLRLFIPQGKFTYGNDKKNKLKKLWRLRSVNRTFKYVMDNSQLEKPTVGVRIQNILEYDYGIYAESEEMYHFYIYGAKGTGRNMQCVNPHGFSAALAPCVIEPFLVVQGISLNDEFLNGLKSMKLDRIEIALFYDIKGFNFCLPEGVTLADKIREIIYMFPQAMKIEFFGLEMPQGVFDAVGEVDNMTRTDETDLTESELRVRYRKVREESKHKKNPLNTMEIDFGNVFPLDALLGDFDDMDDEFDMEDEFDIDDFFDADVDEDDDEYYSDYDI